MKPFFIFLLILSTIFPFYTFFQVMSDYAHNQYSMRLSQLERTITPTQQKMSDRYGAPRYGHFGLDATQLSKMDELTVSAYKDAVHDGYRLGRGYQRLWIQTMALDFLLFVASILGLRKLRLSGGHLQ